MNLMQTYTENASATYKTNLDKLGINDLEDPDTISIFPKDFDSKEEIEKIIDKYNESKSEEEKITYTDMVGLMMSSVSTIVDIISNVLIAFVAISLIVSSIMIAIITYISVIERTKEIGILRSLGARKKDIKRIFKCEAFTIGIFIGILSSVISLCISRIMKLIIYNNFNFKFPNINIEFLIIGLCLSILLTILSSLIPSSKASKIDPIEALRYE